MTITQLIDSQKKLFDSGKSLDISFRLDQLRKLRTLIRDHQEQLCDAVFSDFGKPRFESWSTEIMTLLREIDFHMKNLSGWAKPVTVKGSMMTFPSKNRYYYQPYGTTLIIGPWNYPVRLLLHPLVGAISAGNTAILKPSELAPETSGMITELISSHFDPGYLVSVEGGENTGKELLRHSFDYIFFTGSSRVGKIVMKAAAEHLTPLTLELGGKSPAIVHKDANVRTSARRIWWGKCINSGQTCIAPDFVTVHRDAVDSFIDHSRDILDDFYGNPDPGTSPTTKIINNHHFKRLTDLLSGSTPILGGSTDPGNRRIDPALIKADWDHPAMENEIFGPILPLIVYDQIGDLINRLRNMPSPLALYLFTNTKEIKQRVIRDLPFGGGCINDTITHLASPELPVGGVGNSGMGSYQGQHSFETFSRKKSILEKPFWPDPDFRYPPYTSSKYKVVKALFS